MESFPFALGVRDFQCLSTQDECLLADRQWNRKEWVCLDAITEQSETFFLERARDSLTLLSSINFYTIALSRIPTERFASLEIYHPIFFRRNCFAVIVRCYIRRKKRGLFFIISSARLRFGCRKKERGKFQRCILCCALFQITFMCRGALWIYFFIIWALFGETRNNWQKVSSAGRVSPSSKFNAEASIFLMQPCALWYCNLLAVSAHIHGPEHFGEALTISLDDRRKQNKKKLSKERYGKKT